MDLTGAPVFPPTAVAKVKSETAVSCAVATFANELAAMGYGSQTTDGSANRWFSHSK
jgi:hypothetical protein